MLYYLELMEKVMNKTEFIAAIADELNEEITNVNDQTVLADIEGWDSMAVLGVIALIDSQFGVVVEGDALGKCTTVGDIFELINSM